MDHLNIIHDDFLCLSEDKLQPVNRLLCYLVVLVGGDGDEGGLVEDVGAVGRVLGPKRVVFIRFHDVEPRLVLVHRVQDDLGKEEMQQQVLFFYFSHLFSVSVI